MLKGPLWGPFLFGLDRLFSAVKIEFFEYLLKLGFKV